MYSEGKCEYRTVMGLAWNLSATVRPETAVMLHFSPPQLLRLPKHVKTRFLQSPHSMQGRAYDEHPSRKG